MNAIVILAKEPRPYHVKTRMYPCIDFDIILRIYHGFLMDRIQQISGISETDHLIAYTPHSAEKFFRAMALDDYDFLPQEGNGLGERLSNIFHALFKKGYGKVVILDSDSPNLPSIYIRNSLDYLDESDIVLGPCEDGGYYLVGLSDYIPEIFVDIPWSTPEVTRTTVKKAETAGKTLVFLDKWYDVDTPEDLLRLRDDLNGKLKETRDMYFCKNTYDILSKIDLK